MAKPIRSRRAERMKASRPWRMTLVAERKEHPENGTWAVRLAGRNDARGRGEFVGSSRALRLSRYRYRQIAARSTLEKLLVHAATLVLGQRCELSVLGGRQASLRRVRLPEVTRVAQSKRKRKREAARKRTEYRKIVEAVHRIRHLRAVNYHWSVGTPIPVEELSMHCSNCRYAVLLEYRTYTFSGPIPTISYCDCLR